MPRNRNGNANRNANANQNVNANRNVNANQNVNVNRNVNVNQNVNVNRDVNVNGGYYNDGCCFNGGGLATAAAITTAAAVTAAAIGSMVNTLPPSCSAVSGQRYDVPELRRHVLSAAVCRHECELCRSGPTAVTEAGLIVVLAVFALQRKAGSSSMSRS